ncbi:uncharacterized protein CEXT_25941, partial [Caerostris extrusa]
MASTILENAIQSCRSTIIFGNLGRYPRVLEYYLRHLLIPMGEKDNFPSWFRTLDGRDVYVWIEPTFGTAIPSNTQNIVLTSHLDLKWDVRSTRVVSCHIGDALLPLPWFEDTVKPYKIIEKSTHHPYIILNEAPHLVLCLDTDDAHEAYLCLLTFGDEWIQSCIQTPWTVFWKDSVKKRLKMCLSRSWDNVQNYIKSDNLASLRRRYLPQTL